VGRFQRSAIMPYSAPDVYGLVNDVEQYPEFLKWCTASEILEQTTDEMMVRMMFSAHGVTESMVTRNRLVRDARISLVLVEGPFRHFSGYWTFTPIGNGCRVHLVLEFDLKSITLNVLSAPVLNRVADTLVDSFSQRAKAVLEPGLDLTSL
jgi:ribosome-associated toxin RatA of RatAB toxin-antitoxin module